MTELGAGEKAAQLQLSQSFSYQGRSLNIKIFPELQDLIGTPQNSQRSQSFSYQGRSLNDEKDEND